MEAAGLVGLSYQVEPGVSTNRPCATIIYADDCNLYPHIRVNLALSSIVGAASPPQYAV